MTQKRKVEGKRKERKKGTKERQMGKRSRKKKR